jgi:hemerythrin-like domain-containing protein
MVKIELQKAPPVKEGPIEHLFACHRRIEDRLSILERAGAHLESAPGEALTAITNSLRFMDTSGVLHTVDEEQSVFPRLRGHLTQEELAYLDELESQHREADRVYESLKGVVAALTQSRTPELIQQYRDLVQRLAHAYRDHIASEDENLLPIGRRVLDEAELREIHSEMRGRRG